MTREANKTQKQERKSKQEKGKPGKDHTKRTMLILAGIALVLILLVGALLVTLFSGLNTAQPKSADLERWLAGNWRIFQLRRWDEETGALELDYPLRFTYEQMKAYGADLEELRDLPAGNLATASSLKLAAREAIGVTVREVTIYGLTTDGQIAYTVKPDGTVEACWDSP